MKTLNERWHSAFARIVEHYPDAFRGSDLDPAATLQRMEKLASRIEAFLKDVREPATGQSQAEILAARLRSAFASNAMGGRGGEDAKWRAAADAVKDAQSSWQRLPPVAGADAQAIESRFRDACRKVLDQARRHGSSGSGGSTSSSRRSPNRPAAAAV
jgi:hypothetical protein